MKFLSCLCGSYFWWSWWVASQADKCKEGPDVADRFDHHTSFSGCLRSCSCVSVWALEILALNIIFSPGYWGGKIILCMKVPSLWFLLFNQCRVFRTFWKSFRPGHSVYSCSIWFDMPYWGKDEAEHQIYYWVTDRDIFSVPRALS